QEWPQQKQALLMGLRTADSARPDAVLVPAVEEVLRFESSNQLGNRRALKPCVVGGTELPAGALVTLCIGAANRDPAQFPQPDELVLDRAENRHLAFGFGIHQCAGLSLARLEGRVAIGRFLARFPEYRLTTPPTRGGRVRFRGFLHAPFAVA
ncbi:MAG: cytochrome P450, partial [Ramlibacter sp.]